MGLSTSTSSASPATCGTTAIRSRGSSFRAGSPAPGACSRRRCGARCDACTAAIKNEAVAEGLTGHLKPLAELDRAFEKPLNELEQAQGALALAQSKSAQARDVYLDARAVLQATLAARFPREARYVNSFFRPGAIAKVKKLPAPVPAPAGVSTVKAQANGAAS